MTTRYPSTHRPQVKWSKSNFAIPLKSELCSAVFSGYLSYSLLAQVTLQKHHSEVFQHSKKYQSYGSSSEAVMAVKEG